MSRGAALTWAKAEYVAAISAAGRGLERAGVVPSTAPPRGHRVRHWAYSLGRVHDFVALTELDVPWWTYAAVDAVDTWLSGRPRPVRVFEYGAGASTVWLARRTDEVVSVEHEPAFADTLRPVLERAGNATLLTVEAPVRAEPVRPSAKEGYQGRDFADYVAAIDTVDGEFDLIVVDGRARAASLERALPRLCSDGLVVFDNSRRRRYRPVIDAAVGAGLVSEQRLRGLTPTLPYPEQTSLLVPAPR